MSKKLRKICFHFFFFSSLRFTSVAAFFLRSSDCFDVNHFPMATHNFIVMFKTKNSAYRTHTIPIYGQWKQFETFQFQRFVQFSRKSSGLDLKNWIQKVGRWIPVNEEWKSPFFFLSISNAYQVVLFIHPICDSIKWIYQRDWEKKIRWNNKGK